MAVTNVLLKTLKIGDESDRVVMRLKRRLALALLLSSLAINGAVAGSNLLVASIRHHARCGRRCFRQGIDHRTTSVFGVRQMSGLVREPVSGRHAASTLGDEQQHLQASHH